MNNTSDIVNERRSSHEEHSDGSESPDREPKHEDSGEARQQLYSEVLVHASADGERSSPDYMDTRDGERCSSPSSSSDDDEVKDKEVVEREVEVVPVIEVSGEAHNGSRRSSASSASSAAPPDPCDVPTTHDEDNAEDAHTRSAIDTKPEVSVDYSPNTLQNVTLDESSAAPADPSQPEISLFVKVRAEENTFISAEVRTVSEKTWSWYLALSWELNLIWRKHKK